MLGSGHPQGTSAVLPTTTAGCHHEGEVAHGRHDTARRLELTGVADPRIAPDGATVAYVVSALDGEANEYRGAIWLAALDGSSPPRRLTAGTRRDAAPRLSPDGSPAGLHL